MPLGKDGKIPSGLLISLLNLSQKHLGQSFSKLNDDGENLYGILDKVRHVSLKRFCEKRTIFINNYITN